VNTNFHPGRFLLLAAAIFTLVAAIWAGLLRMQWAMPMLRPTLPLAHGPLMVSGFLGILICLERAVALNRWWAYLAPALTAAGTVFFLFGSYGNPGPLLITLGSAALVGDFAVILRRQPALFTWTMALGALAWLVGNLLWLFHVPITTFVYWWAGFLVLTIAGERLELSRLASRGSGARLFLLFLLVYIAGLAWISVHGVRGLQITGAGMLLLTAWLVRRDVARRTVRIPGLPRFMALHLLCGYFWLALGGVLGTAAPLFQQFPWRSYHYDAMLHTVFLGFVFSMIFAHAPVIFPAVTGRQLAYNNFFYVHGALLHLSVLLRAGGDLAGHVELFRWSGLLTMVSIAVFMANTARGLIAGSKRAPLAAKAVSR
jgi:hypothetical protein